MQSFDSEPAGIGNSGGPGPRVITSFVSSSGLLRALRTGTHQDLAPVHFPRSQPRGWFSGTSRNFFSQNSMVQWLLVNWHNTHSSQNLIFILILTHTFSFIPRFRPNYQVPEGGVSFCARAHEPKRAPAEARVHRVFFVSLSCARSPLKLQPNN